MYYTCIACIAIEFVIRMEKKNFKQIYLDERKHRMKKIKMTKLIEAELESESKSELKSGTTSELKSDTE